MTRNIVDEIGQTPLVPLQHIAKGLPVPIYVKCEHLNPGGSVKDRIALAIIEDAEKRGQLKRGMTIIEATAGNTGMGLALVAAVRGYKVVCVMPKKMSIDKRHALARVGARVLVTPNVAPDHPRNFRRVADRLAKEEGWFLADQFRNPANVRIHEETTGPEIVVSLGRKIGAFVAGMGTGGTITGVGRYLKRVAKGVRIVLADPVGSGLAQWVETGEMGPDAAYKVEGIGGSAPLELVDRSVIDATMTISDEDSFLMARRLIREEGLLVGGSAGTAVCAAVRVAASGEVTKPVVALLPDSWDRYYSREWLR
jgi:cysteine synthase